MTQENTPLKRIKDDVDAIFPKWDISVMLQRLDSQLKTEVLRKPLKDYSRTEMELFRSIEKSILSVLLQHNWINYRETAQDTMNSSSYQQLKALNKYKRDVDLQLEMLREVWSTYKNVYSAKAMSTRNLESMDRHMVAQFTSFEEALEAELKKISQEKSKVKWEQMY